MKEHNTRLGNTKQEIQEFKAEFNSLLVDLKNEIQTKIEDVNNKLDGIKKNIKINITEQVNESVISIKEVIIDALKEESFTFGKHVIAKSSS